MRCSPTRFVLAALALIVGAVLALPMLLSRKAEAGEAPPKLEAEAGTARALTTEPGQQSWSGDGNDVSGDVPSMGCSLAVLLDNRLPDFELSANSVASRLRPPACPGQPASSSPSRSHWPDPHEIDRRRKYHLRP